MKKGYRTSREMQRQRERNLKLFLLGLGGLAAVLLLVFLLAAGLKGLRRLPGLPGAPATETASGETSSEAQTEYVPPGGQAGLLIASVEPGTGVSMLWYLDVDLDERIVTVFSVDPASLCSVEGVQASLSGHYLAGGFSRLVNAVNIFSEKEVDRYIGVTEKNFLKAVKELGPVDVYVETDVNYVSGDVSLQLKKGMRQLDFNSLGNYLKFGAAGRDALLALQEDAMCSMLTTYFQNDALVKKGEPLFTKLINLVESDISAYDYYDHLRALEFLASGEVSFVTGKALRQ
ncbi:MAG: LCP family protein [Oscillospiraceae bacterium]|jgi:hypothetical protein|nr:LCP family protein [Oscillospiraceae bacterium]